VIEPSEVFSVSQYKNLATKAIANIHARQKFPFLVGGTPLYIDAVARGLDIPAIPPDQILREKLEAKTPTELLAKLAKLDPEFAKQVDQKNKRRLVRAIEVCEKSGKKFSKLRQKEIRSLSNSFSRHQLAQRKIISAHWWNDWANDETRIVERSS